MVAPNIIFVLTDDQRADTVGFMGNEIVQTPNLDQMAQDGVVFDNAFVTSAICTPSRACFFLGQYERKHGVNFNSGTSMADAAWQNSYPMILRQAGYFTGYVGKNHVPIGEGGYGSGVIEEGFDYWYGGHGHLGFYPKKRHGIFRNAQADTQIEIIDQGVSNFLDPNEEFYQEAVRFLDKRPTDKPFCLSVCFNVPHNSATSSMRMLPDDPEIYRTLYRDQKDTLPLKDTYIAKEEITSPKLPQDVLWVKNRQTGYDYVDTPEKVRENWVRVLQTVTGLDRFMGNMRNKLEALGVADETVIIFTSDHGIMCGEHGLGGKALNYEECLHVPMFIYDPRLTEGQSGRRLDDLVLSIDVAPTILSMAGVDTPDSMQGRDLTALLRGDEVNWREYAFAENLWATYFGNPRVESVRSKEFKYIRYFPNHLASLIDDVENKYGVTDRVALEYERSLYASINGEQPIYEELFCLASDPLETTNLVNDSNSQGILQQMRVECNQQVAAARGDEPPLTVALTLERQAQIKKEVPED